jgi:hypothetical protein
MKNRLTYANVMSSLAVFLVLGGATAFAATKIGANQLKANSVKTGKIVKEAVTTSKIKNNAVNTAKIANDAVTGAKANESTFGTVPSAANANALGGKAAGDYSVRYFARVNGSGGTPTLAAGSPGVSVSPDRPFTGAVVVVFPVNMDNCAVVATPVSGGETLSARQSTASFNGGNNVGIVIEDHEGGLFNASFNIIGVC